MRIFLSYAGEHRRQAEGIAIRLRQDGHDVFFDRQRLEPGKEYDRTIRTEIDACELFVFLISPESVARGGYALTELSMAQDRWPNPSGRLLPVMISETPLDDVPSYATSVTILEPRGNAVAEVAAEVEKLSSGSSSGRTRLLIAVAGIVVITFLVVVLWREFVGPDSTPEPPTPCLLDVRIAPATALRGLSLRVVAPGGSQDFSVGQSGLANIDIPPNQLLDWTLELIDRDGAMVGSVAFDGCPTAGASYPLEGGLTVAVAPRS
jgi:hypothetical protein